MADKKNPKKIALASGAAVLCVGVLVYIIASSVSASSSSPQNASRHRNLIDSKTLVAYAKYPVPDNALFPLKNPKTGENTLYQAELCYWTKDGKAKLSPTFVLLNEQLGQTGQTMCPDCGRRVIVHNPMPPIELMEKAAK